MHKNSQATRPDLVSGVTRHHFSCPRAVQFPGKQVSGTGISYLESVILRSTSRKVLPRENPAWGVCLPWPVLTTVLNSSTGWRQELFCQRCRQHLELGQESSLLKKSQELHFLGLYSGKKKHRYSPSSQGYSWPETTSCSGKNSLNFMWQDPQKFTICCHGPNKSPILCSPTQLM